MSKKLQKQLGLKWGIWTTFVIAAVAGYVLFQNGLTLDELQVGVMRWLFNSSATLFIGGVIAYVIQKHVVKRLKKIQRKLR